MQNLHRTEELVAQFRQHRLAGNQVEDVLQFYTTLWYAWVSLSAITPHNGEDRNT
jgi:hypothetical protein